MGLKKQTVEWVTMGPSPHFATCKRCGEHVEPPKLPMPIRAFVKYLDYALELHRHCRALESLSISNDQQHGQASLI